MEKKMRRDQINFYIALIGSSIAIAGIAVLFPRPLVICGAVASIAGFAFLAYEVLQHRRRAPAAENGAVASAEYHRALLQHRIEFHRKRLWLRVAALAPGGVLFFLGFAAARPDLAALIYVELVTFIVAIVLIIPVNRRAAAKLGRQIAEVERLR